MCDLFLVDVGEKDALLSILVFVERIVPIFGLDKSEKSKSNVYRNV